MPIPLSLKIALVLRSTPSDVAEGVADRTGVVEPTTAFVSDWLPRFASALRTVHPVHTAKLVARALNDTGLCSITEHAVERWLSANPPRPSGDAVLACLQAFGLPWLVDVLGPGHPLARQLAVRLESEAFCRRLMAELVDERLAQRGLVPGDQGGGR